MLVVEFRRMAATPDAVPVIAGPFEDGSLTITTHSIYRRRKDGSEGAHIASSDGNGGWTYAHITYGVADVREFDPKRHQLPHAQTQ